MPLALPALAQDAGQTRLVLSETASREVEQDTLVAVLSVRAESASAREAQSAVNSAMTAAIEKARAVASVRAATGGYRVHQQYDRDGRPTTWIAEQDLRLTGKESVPLLELVGQLQDAGLNLGGLAYELSDEARRALENDLAIEAIAAVRQRAERIAASMGMRIDAIRTVRVGGEIGEPPPRPMMRMSMAESADMAPPTALPDLETVSVGVEAELTLAPR
ncbi:MAG: SIMPL domain-containing protein [Geminicoccales bacterium]